MLKFPGTAQPERIGLLAGAGRFPIAFARAAQQQGRSVFCVGVQGMASDELGDICDDFATTPLGRLGKAIRLFKKANVKQAVMAGKIEKKVLFQRFRWLHNIRDNKSDDSLLLAVIREFERDDIRFQSALDFCPELLVQHGFLTRRKPSSAQWRDIRFGWDTAKEMGRLDIGQSVCIYDTAVIAVEAIEGTDEAIRRAGLLCRRSGFCVVKVAKPQQDMRFDVPTIGMQTIQTMYEAGARVLAIESAKTIVLDQEQTVELADKLGIAIVALNADELALRAAS